MIAPQTELSTHNDLLMSIIENIYASLNDTEPPMPRSLLMDAFLLAVAHAAYHKGFKDGGAIFMEQA